MLGYIYADNKGVEMGYGFVDWEASCIYFHLLKLNLYMCLCVHVCYPNICEAASGVCKLFNDENR